MLDCFNTGTLNCLLPWFIAFVTTTLVTFPDSDIRLSIPILCFTIFWLCVPSMSLSAEKIADIPGVLASLSFRYCLMLSFFSFERGGVLILSCSSFSFCGVRGSSALSSPILDLLGFWILVGVDGST